MAKRRKTDPKLAQLISVKVTDDQKLAYDDDEELADRARDIFRKTIMGHDVNKDVPLVPQVGLQSVIPRISSFDFTEIILEADKLFIYAIHFASFLLSHSHEHALLTRMHESRLATILIPTFEGTPFSRDEFAIEQISDHNLVFCDLNNSIPGLTVIADGRAYASASFTYGRDDRGLGFCWADIPDQPECQYRIITQWVERYLRP